MLFTLLFVLIFLAGNKTDAIFYKKTDDEIENSDNELELFEVDNSSNHLYNPVDYDSYWTRVQKELFRYLMKSLAIILCIWIDIAYIKYTYLQN
jgi:hypothetical protein